ncbi:putative nuclease of restriction endonuclease-like (RecB) superfamily [Chryseobacterium sp. SORGH_AS 447]|uniref:PDDEXK nuclease domain-containing protein n=1 Tax=Chryseobacterium sp. SORGH_AS_0447 TaxID=3041769 RepID=UPI00278313B8|nr:PDDEXK nuclease domain-containing protein [Chryseobacterium sp. SORGH_AS_0447]MDQ1163298.1 putative nuclease of restriction endonuclease-like (RecB) superfamily [Chryseobacterium sp. SORGH_AS_0447]
MEISEDVLFQSIKEMVIQSREKVFRMANSTLLFTYWQIGKLIVEEEQKGKERAAYGKYTLKNLSKKLTLEFGKGFDYTNLSNMRKFFIAFPIVDALRQQLSWTHYRLLIKLSDSEKIDYYINESIQNNWNSRDLKRQINSLAYERVIEPQKSPAETIQNVLKDPYIFEFLGLKPDEKISEKDLETAIIDHIQKFLLEFGKGFAFVARQQHIVTDTSDFYIDLVFYNYILKCFVIIDLKTGELSHQDIGQIDMYVRMYDDLKRGEGDNPTIGILLCSEKDETIVKYSVLNDKNNLFASKYLLYLPKEEELKQLIDQDRIRFELDQDDHPTFN